MAITMSTDNGNTDIQVLVNGAVTASGGFEGTASYALTASYLNGFITSASYADTAATASYLDGVITSASYAITASYALNGGTGGDGV